MDGRIDYVYNETCGEWGYHEELAARARLLGLAPRAEAGPAALPYARLTYTDATLARLRAKHSRGANVASSQSAYDKLRSSLVKRPLERRAPDITVEVVLIWFRPDLLRRSADDLLRDTSDLMRVRRAAHRALAGGPHEPQFLVAGVVCVCPGVEEALLVPPRARALAPAAFGERYDAWLRGKPRAPVVKKVRRGSRTPRVTLTKGCKLGLPANITGMVHSPIGEGTAAELTWMDIFSQQICGCAGGTASQGVAHMGAPGGGPRKGSPNRAAPNPPGTLHFCQVCFSKFRLRLSIALSISAWSPSDGAALAALLNSAALAMAEALHGADGDVVRETSLFAKRRKPCGWGVLWSLGLRGAPHWELSSEALTYIREAIKPRLLSKLFSADMEGVGGTLVAAPTQRAALTGRGGTPRATIRISGLPRLKTPFTAQIRIGNETLSFDDLVRYYLQALHATQMAIGLGPGRASAIAARWHAPATLATTAWTRACEAADATQATAAARRAAERALCAQWALLLPPDERGPQLERWRAEPAQVKKHERALAQCRGLALTPFVEVCAPGPVVRPAIKPKSKAKNKAKPTLAPTCNPTLKPVGPAAATKLSVVYGLPDPAVVDMYEACRDWFKPSRQPY